MRILLLSLAAITAVLGIIMAILPFDIILILPGLLAIITGIGAYIISKKQQKPKKVALLFVIIGVLVASTGPVKSFLIKDEIATDKEFQQKEEQSKEDAIKELEEIEGELEELEGDLEEIETE